MIHGSSVTVRLRETPVSAVELPESIVRYAARTQESVILDDAAAQNPFSTDEYIREQRPRSVLCLPLVKQGVLVAVLYMENNLGPNFFAPGRIAVRHGGPPTCRIPAGRRTSWRAAAWPG